MRRALHIALGAGATEQAGRAYANMHELLFTRQRWAEAEEYFAEGVVYCDEHDMATFGTCLRGGHCEPLFALGRWSESLALCRRLLGSVDSPVNRSRPLIVAARILAHRGEQSARAYLDEAVVT